MKYNLNMKKAKFDLNEKHNEKKSFEDLWASQRVVNHAMLNNDNKPLFLLHDGPPYANGSLHCGHFTNKVLKDTLLKYKRLNGFYAPFYNGSDCHGLPVELAVEKEYKKNKVENKLGFVKACYAYANKQVESQQKQLKSFGLLADFSQSYKTNNYDYEYEEMKAVLTLTEKGLLFQKFRPVHWCLECQSSLAEAELEYKTKKSDSLTVKFAVSKMKNTYFLVWTTTPYTLPANKAVAFNKNFAYGKYYSEEKEEYYVLLKESDLAKKLTFCEDVNPESMELVSPYHGNVVLAHYGNFVERSGTGFVHVAPSFGLDDFHFGENYCLKTENYLDEKGVFVNEDFEDLKGKHVREVNKLVLEKLKSSNLVYGHFMFDHEYPHCWRHKSPLFTRTSMEWFMDLSVLQDNARESLEKVEFFPENGKSRLDAMLKGRSSWCVSRRRLWGVPLPFDLSEKALNEYKEWMGTVLEKGLSELYRDNNFNPLTLDVWFDSGVSHQTVVKKLFSQHVSDLYLEGSDQHRGWFQSSLLTSMALEGTAPYKQVLTHGFVVDANGHKLSKSKGNYVELTELFKEYSPDLLRLWALGQDFHKDVTYSQATLNNTLEKYKKFRNTFRFMLQNLYNVTEKELMNFSGELDLLDKYVVSLTNDLESKVLLLAEQYKFNEVEQELYVFCETLSSVYLDTQKDRLYCLAENNERRKMTQKVLMYVQKKLLVLLAPLMPYSMEEYYQKSVFFDNKSVFELEKCENWDVDFSLKDFEEVLVLKETFNKLFEDKRVNKELSNNNEMAVFVEHELTSDKKQALSLLLGKVHVLKGEKLSLLKHDFTKCDRCRNYFEHLENEQLCHSCFMVESQHAM